MEINDAVNVLRRFFRAQRRLPSYQEMCGLFGFASKQASFRLAQKLIEEKFLSKDDTGRLVPNRLFTPLPVLGTIAAGVPSEATEAFMNALSFDDYLVNRPEKSYILRVSGDSMIDEGIHEGDLVVIEKDREPKNGDIVVAFIDNGFTLKYFHREGNRVWLSAANKRYADIHPQNSLAVFGIVVSIIRKYH